MLVKLHQTVQRSHLSTTWKVTRISYTNTKHLHVCIQNPFQPVTSDETVAVGGTVTLTCRVAESDNSSLQWSNTAQQTLYFGEKRALRDNRIQLYKSTPTELSITISEVQLSDDGEYTCSIFTMPVRTARATVTVLGVPGKPVITGYEDAVQEGSSVTLTCSSSGSKPPAQLYWYRGPDRMEGTHTHTHTHTQTRTHIHTHTRTHKHTHTHTHTQTRTHIHTHTHTHKHPESDLPREGEKFHLQCVGNGNPEPMSFKWWKKDGELPPLVKEDGAVLRFEVLNKSDNGVYLCQADNGVGAGDGAYTLLVQGTPWRPAPLPVQPHSYFCHFSMSTSSGVDHAVIGGVVAVIVFIMLCLLIILGRYLIRHKGTYLTHEAKGSDDAPDADTAIINAEGGQSGADDKKEYFI
uniref:Cell adhesion molecule 3 n=1 Tax=Electrophorus electricus TaxID=8005 RepID=A0AAY5F1W5_ELEEL